MKNKKPIIALGALAVVGLIAGTIAYFTSEATFDNVFTTAVYKTKSEETFNSPDNWTPGTTTPKTITTTNEGNIPVAVRVSYEDGWTRKQTDPQTGEETEVPIQNPPANAVIINYANTNDWTHQVESGVDYWYYNNPLQPNGVTSSFISGVTLNPDLQTTGGCTTTYPQGETAENHTSETQTCTTSIAGLGVATYTLTITVETVQYDKYDEVWTGAPTIPVQQQGNGD
jgi:alternate signal-mediated exported protein